MQTNFFDVDNDILNAVKYMPSVSVIIPFEPKMSLKSEIEYKLKTAIDRVKEQLETGYPAEKSQPVLNRLKEIVKKLDYSTYKKSIAIFVSALMEKLYYLDFTVEEKIIVDESFEIRDLIYSKKELHKYLVLVLSSQANIIYLGNTIRFVRIISHLPEHVSAYKNDIAERVANFSDPSQRNEIMLEKFLRYTDEGLAILLKAYPLPVFVMATERTAGHFKKITHNSGRILAFVHGNFEEATDAELRKALQPHIADWKKVKQEDLKRQLDAAMGARKLATGIQDVWKEAVHKKGRLLVVEKNFMYPARHGAEADIIYKKEYETGNDLYIKDAVDDVIEKVLENGGDVEFVDDEVLNDYKHIALIQYY
jgi:Bacterial archaeo-eukaryotic release factor family 3